MAENITRTKDKNGKITVTRNTTVRQDLADIGRMFTGGRGGRQRRQAIDDRVDEAQGVRRK